MVKAYIFDAFGTLFNLDEQLLSDIEHPHVSDILQYARNKQLSYTWIQTLMDRYLPFDEITKNVLEDGCSRYGAPKSLVLSLQRLYFEPVVFSDVSAALTKLSSHSTTIGILSNGTRNMLNSGIRKNELRKYIDVIFSADDIETYKPSPQVYKMVTSGLNLPLNEIRFISSNQWDIAGAANFGFNVTWVNRMNEPMECLLSEFDVQVVNSLEEIV